MQLRWHVEIRTSLQVNKVKSSDRKQESRVESMSDLESELRKMQPASAEQSQAELMYRCGWEAALAQQEAESEVLAPSVSTADPADSQKQAFSFANFGSGALFGAAACLLLTLNAGLWSAGQAPSCPSDNLAGNPPLHSKTDRPPARPRIGQEESPIIPDIDGLQFVDSMREFAAGIQSTIALSDLREPILLASKEEVDSSDESLNDTVGAGTLSVFGSKELSIRAHRSLAGNRSWFGLGGDF